MFIWARKKSTVSANRVWQNEFRVDISLQKYQNRLSIFETTSTMIDYIKQPNTWHLIHSSLSRFLVYELQRYGMTRSVVCVCMYIIAIFQADWNHQVNQSKHDDICSGCDYTLANSVHKFVCLLHRQHITFLTHSKWMELLMLCN